MIGVDTEFFLLDEESGLAVPALKAMEQVADDTYVSLWKDIAGPGFLGYNSLEKPLTNSKLTEDGLAVETPVKPSSDILELIHHIGEGANASLELARNVGADLVAQPLVYIDSRDLETRNELRVLGCNPDKSVYDPGGKMCKPAQDPTTTSWRTGGGHIHLSPENIGELGVIEDGVVLCDLLLGTLDVLFEHSNLGKQRREMYGQPGKHRVQPWGLEYRTMSNVWMTHPYFAIEVLKISNLIHRALEREFNPATVIETVGVNLLIKTITDCDVKRAAKIFTQTLKVLKDSGIEDNTIDLEWIKLTAQLGGIVKAKNYSMDQWSSYQEILEV